MTQKISHYLAEVEGRSGKTFILVYALFVRACKEKSRHLVLRHTFSSAKRTLWMDTFIKVHKICFPHLKLKKNNTDYVVFFPNGSEIHLAGLDTGERVEKLLGLELSTIYVNEASQVDYSSIMMVKTRLAEKNNLKKKIYFDFNPPSKAHWSYYLFIKKLDPIDEVPLPDPENYQSMKINPKENLENIDEEYIKMLERMPEKDRIRFLEGDFIDHSDGVVYYAFDADKHVQSVDRSPGTTYLGLDFNINPFCGVVFQYINNKFEVFDELYLENADTHRAMTVLKEKGYKGLMVCPDSTGASRKTSGMTDYDIIESFGHQIMNVRNPFVMDRVNNANRLFASDRVIIDPKCRKLINDLQKVVWKDNKLDQRGANKMLTHISDALGYGLWRLDPFGVTRKSKTYQL